MSRGFRQKIPCHERRPCSTGKIPMVTNPCVFFRNRERPSNIQVADFWSWKPCSKFWKDAPFSSCFTKNSRPSYRLRINAVREGISIRESPCPEERYSFRPLRQGFGLQLVI